jgi:putative nucleotidyltransferase with HDIG domain
MRGLTALRAYTPSGGESKSFLHFFDKTHPERRSTLWAATLAVTASCVAALLVGSGFHLPAWWIVLGLALVTGIAERQSVALLGDRLRGIETSVSFLPTVFTAVAFGPLAAFAVAALSNLADFRRPYLKWAVYTPAHALGGAAAGLIAGSLIPASDWTFTEILVASLGGAIGYLALDFVTNLATQAIRGWWSPLSYLRAMVPLSLIAIPLYVPAVSVLVYGYARYSLAIVAMVFIPILALQRVVHLYQEQRAAAQSLAEVNRQLERANLSFAAALVATLDARDRYTAGHSAAVARYSRDIAERMGLSEDDRQLVYLSGLVHDIGKIGLPAGLLEKPGALTLEERRQMQDHSEIGERILSNVEDYADIAKIVRHHHERVDGNGYPDGIEGEEIPLLARIIGVADAYDAMTSDRPYREAMPSRVARMRLAQAVETQFDTTIVAAFEAVLAGADEKYRLGGRDLDFSQELRPIRQSAEVA